MYLFSDLRKFRTYKGHNVRDLLRAMRNKVRYAPYSLLYFLIVYVRHTLNKQSHFDIKFIILHQCFSVDNLI